jgi:hypothetical protein
VKGITAKCAIALAGRGYEPFLRASLKLIEAACHEGLTWTHVPRPEHFGIANRLHDELRRRGFTIDWDARALDWVVRW